MTTRRWSDEVSIEAILRDLLHRDPIHHDGSGDRTRDSCRLCFATPARPDPTDQTVSVDGFDHHRTCVWARAWLLPNARRVT